MQIPDHATCYRIAQMLISCATDTEKLGLNILTILHMFQVQKLPV
jgi:hypothetical protein